MPSSTPRQSTPIRRIRWTCAGNGSTSTVRPGFPVFVLEEDGVIAGFATYGNFRPWPAYKYSIEHSIYVHKDFRRRHIATRLMEKLLEAANGLAMRP